MIYYLLMCFISLVFCASILVGYLSARKMSKKKGSKIWYHTPSTSGWGKMPETLMVKLLSWDSSNLHLFCHMDHCWGQRIKHTGNMQKDPFVQKQGSCCWKLFQLTCQDQLQRLTNLGQPVPLLQEGMAAGKRGCLQMFISPTKFNQ